MSKRLFTDEYELNVIMPYYREFGMQKTMDRFNMSCDTILYNILDRHNEPLRGNGYNNLDRIAVCKYYSKHGKAPTLKEFNIKTSTTLYNILNEYNIKRKGFTPENHRSWQGGITPEADREYERIRRSKGQQVIRSNVLKRDKNQCQVSGSRDVEIHHIFPIKTFPEKAYDMNNIITISVSFHNKIKKHEEDYIDYLSQLQLDRGLPL